MNQKTRKGMPMYKALHPRNKTKKCLEKKGESGLTDIEDCVDSTILGLKEYTK